MDKKTSLRINNRRETTFGIVSVGCGLISIVLFLIAVYQSAYGQLDGLVVGAVELLAMISALVGFVFGFVGETRLDKFHKTAHIGILLNGVVGVFHVIVLIQGY